MSEPESAVEPLTISYDPLTDIVTVGDQKFSGDFFRCMADPDPELLYRFIRRGELTTIQEVRREPCHYQSAV